MLTELCHIIYLILFSFLQSREIFILIANLLNMTSHAAHDLTTRAQVIALKIIDASNQQIEQQTGVKECIIISIYNQAIQQDFDPKTEQSVICDIHVEDASCSG